MFPTLPGGSPGDSKSQALEYLAHLKLQFHCTPLEKLAEEVEALLASSPYVPRIEREIQWSRNGAVQRGYINDDGTLTRRAEFTAFGRYPFKQGLPNYHAYAKEQLEAIASGFNPQRPKR